MFMGKLIYMNVTIALYNEQSIQHFMMNSEVKVLNDNFYLIINEKE